MAKSSRSKWKKQHRRQRAQDELANVAARLSKLHGKLQLTVKGGISAVPSQEPESRFHFVNPELDPNVPNTSKELNNNYRAELNHAPVDFRKPLTLPPPKTNFYGKSDPTAPHPMTQNYDTVDADAPIAGRALTKEDLARMEQRAAEEAATAAAVTLGASQQPSAGKKNGAANANNKKNKQQQQRHLSKANEEEDDDDDDEPEEMMFDITDTRLTRLSGATAFGSTGEGLTVSSSSSSKRKPATAKAAKKLSAAKEEFAAVKRSAKATTGAAAAAGSTSRGGSKKKGSSAAVNEDADEEGEAQKQLRSPSIAKVHAAVTASGTEKGKKLGTAAAPSSRMVSSGSTSAAKAAKRKSK